MNNFNFLRGTLWLLGLALSGSGCSGGAASNEGEGTISQIEIQLTTRTASGNEYRLAPASFTVQNNDPYSGAVRHVTTSATDPSLRVDVDPGSYTVSLDDGWELKRVLGDGQLEPQSATLISPKAVNAWVREFETTPVTFGFHLGVSGIDIGISVQEGNVPPGFDGRISAYSNGETIYYGVELSNNGGSCCFSSVDEARAAFPSLRLYWPTP